MIKQHTTYNIGDTVSVYMTWMNKRRRTRGVIREVSTATDPYYLVLLEDGSSSHYAPTHMRKIKPFKSFPMRDVVAGLLNSEEVYLNDLRKKYWKQVSYTKKLQVLKEFLK